MLRTNGWKLVYTNAYAGLLLKNSVHTKFFQKLKADRIVYPEKKKTVYFP